MATVDRDEAAARAGVDPAFVDRVVELGLVTPADGVGFSAGDVRRIQLTRSLEEAGIALDGVAALVRRGVLSLAFFDAPSYERFAALAPETFREASERTGIPLDLLFVMREANGLAQPGPDDRLRDDELPVVAFLELQMSAGFRRPATERLLRVQGDSMRRIAEQEGSWWYSEVIAPGLAADKGIEQIAMTDLSDRLSPLAETALLSIYHTQQARVWTANIIEGFEHALAEAGLHSRMDRPPAMCFLDITGYTRLTQEVGDDAAADLAASVATLVRRSSVAHGGKPVKWLGDGVMFFFRDPGPGVVAALEMVRVLADAGLPPAHVGLHSGPVLFQEGDYFGSTVNVSARIADYARPGEVLVSQAVAEAAREAPIVFQEIGDVDLKGVAGPMHLLRASGA